MYVSKLRKMGKLILTPGDTDSENYSILTLRDPVSSPHPQT